MADKTEAMEHVIHSSMPIDFERRYAMDNLIAQDADLIDAQPTQSDVERVARALAQADGIEICSDATYALSSYGHKAQAALAAMRQAATHERAKIVAWLREQQTSTEKLRDEMSRHTAGWRFADEHASALEQSAAAIERGEHMQEQSK